MGDEWLGGGHRSQFSINSLIHSLFTFLPPKKARTPSREMGAEELENSKFYNSRHLHFLESSQGRCVSAKLNIFDHTFLRFLSPILNAKINNTFYIFFHNCHLSEFLRFLAFQKTFIFLFFWEQKQATDAPRLLVSPPPLLSDSSRWWRRSQICILQIHLYLHNKNILFSIVQSHVSPSLAPPIFKCNLYTLFLKLTSTWPRLWGYRLTPFLAAKSGIVFVNYL